jgi:hypothetical protein
LQQLQPALELVAINVIPSDTANKQVSSLPEAACSRQRATLEVLRADMGRDQDRTGARPPPPACRTRTWVCCRACACWAPRPSVALRPARPRPTTPLCAARARASAVLVQDILSLCLPQQLSSTTSPHNTRDLAQTTRPEPMHAAAAHTSSRTAPRGQVRGHRSRARRAPCRSSPTS